MKAKSRQSGLTLMEQVVVIAAIALLVVFGLPAVRALFKSLESSGGARAMISAALASARAIAAKEQHYAGIRFQNRYQEDSQGCQYMIFIVHDSDPKPNGTGLANGFRAVEGIEPIKLPDNIGVMDLRYADRWKVLNDVEFAEHAIDTDGEINSERYVWDTTSFSIVFSPSGKLVVHEVRLRNRNGYPDTTSNSEVSFDDVFNKIKQVEEGIGMFYQDDYCGAMSNSYDDMGLGPELSRNSFIIYEKDIFEKVDKNNRWSDYLEDLEVIYINPYTGTMIER